MDKPTEQLEALTKVTVTIEALTKAFELWEKKYRSEPANFLTAEERTEMAVATVAEERAIYFACLLRDVEKNIAEKGHVPPHTRISRT